MSKDEPGAESVGHGSERRRASLSGLDFGLVMGLIAIVFDHNSVVAAVLKGVLVGAFFGGALLIMSRR